MKVSILYHPQSDHSRIVEEFARDFKYQKLKDIELISLETKQGSNLAELYDLVNYPVVIVIKDDDQLINEWQGMPLPLMDEVASYLL